MKQNVKQNAATASLLHENDASKLTSSSSSAATSKNTPPKVTSAKDDFKLDIIFIIIFTILGFYSRYYIIEHPNQPAFDEQHFGKFTNYYIHGEYFLDIHPPLGKLLFTALSKVIGYDGKIDFEDTENDYPDDAYITLRYLPAFFGSLFVPLMYITLRQIRLSPSVAALGGWMVLCENIIITETKHILCDGFLFFFDLLSVCCSFIANNQTPLSGRWMTWMFLTGCAMGCAVSVKLTAMGVIFAIGIHQIFILFKLHRRSAAEFIIDFVSRGILLLVPVFTIFILNFIIHLEILPFSGDGDGFMSAEFRARLLLPTGEIDPEYSDVEAKGMMSSIFELLKTMHDVNIALKATHPFQSWWNEWAFIQCRVLLFWHRIRTGFSMQSYCAGNPFNWISAVTVGVIGYFGLILFACQSIVSIAKKGSISKWCKSQSSSFTVCLFASFAKYWWSGMAIFIGYFSNYLPYSLIPRATWNYHYIPALIFAIIMMCVVVEIILEALKRWDDDAHVIARFVVVVMFAASTYYYLFLAPWTYSLPASDDQNEARFIFESWKA